MKVLMINSVCGVGSTGRICTDIADVLTENGHECKIAFGRKAAPERYRKYAYRITSDSGVKINALKARLFDNEGFNATGATKKLVSFIEKYNPDVIHLHNLHGYYLNAEVLFDYLKKTDKKVIWTLHDCWAFTGHCAYFDYPECNKWKENCGGCGRLNDYPKAITDRAKRNLAKKREIFTGVKNLTIVTPSKWLAELTKQSFLGEYPVKVINNGIDTAVFRPTESDFKEKNGLSGKKIILGVANIWDARKGLEDFIALSKKISDDYRIVLVGLDEKQLGALPENILGITRTSSANELAEIYTAADVLFNPTYEDNYPTVNLEAQACGTPVVTYDTGGSGETIFRDNGKIVEKGDLDSAFGMIKYYAENFADRKIFVEDGKKENKSGIQFDLKNKKVFCEEYLGLFGVENK